MRQITLTTEQIAWCRNVASKRYSRNANNQYAKYENTESSHLVGTLGELGVCILLRQEGIPDVKPNFHANDSLPDIEANGKKIEVKTWSDEHWAFFGRCIQEMQYEKVRKMDYIIWASVWESTVVIHGYSYPWDFEYITPFEMGPKKVLNRQISSVRDIGIMLSILREPCGKPPLQDIAI